MNSRNILIFLLPVIALFGCDSSLDSLNEQESSYSIYGSLDISEDVNYIRIKDLNDPLVGDSTRDFNGTVTLENIDEGTSETLEDSVVKFDDVYTHNFRTTMDINAEMTYKIEVEDSGGEVTSATATAPVLVDTSIVPTDEDCLTPIELTFESVVNPSNFELSVGFQYLGQMHWHSIDFGIVNEAEQRISAEFTPKDIIDGAFELRDQDVWCFEFDTDRLYVDYTQFGPGFYNDLDSDSLDITGGTGTFGILQTNSFDFKIDTVDVCTPFICPDRY